jgi:monoamine oxidase
LQDWATDPLTATDDDQDAAGHHAAAPPSSAEGGAWQSHLIGIGSEWSPQFPGYLAGAVDAAERGVRQSLVHARADPAGSGASKRRLQKSS